MYLVNNNGRRICRLDCVTENTHNNIPLNLLIFSGRKCGKYHSEYIELLETNNNTYDNYKVMLSVIK